MFQYDALAIEDINIYRHWHPGSEKYAGGDSLATALYLGWTMGDTIYWEEHWRAGRLSLVYHFDLERNGEVMTMPVIYNPYVGRLVNETPAQMVPLGERERARERRKKA